MVGVVFVLLPAALLVRHFNAAAARADGATIRLIKVESEKVSQPEIALLSRLASHSSRVVAVRESKGGFVAGEIFSGADVAGTIVRILPNIRRAMAPWATLAGETGLVRGLHADVPSVELIAVTTQGGVWRIDAAGNARRIVVMITGQDGNGAESPVGFEDVTLAPNEPGRYGPWAGRVLAVSRDRSAVYAIDANGAVERFDLGIPRGNNILVIPAGENFFGVARESSGRSSLYGAPASDFAEMAGDLLITQAGGEACGCLPALWRVHWDGAEFQKSKLAELDDREAEWGQVAFSPYGAELLQSPLTLVNAVRSLTGADLNGQRVLPGTTVEYTLTLTNQSTSPVANATIAEYLPANVTYVAGSSRIVTGPNAGVKTDARGDDQVDYFPMAPPNPNGQINFLVGTGAAAFRAGTLAQNESTTVAFRVMVNANAPENTPVNNGGTWGAGDFGIGGESNIVTFIVGGGQPCVPPAITVQPVDRTICGGTSAFFNVTATGTNLTYQWRKDGVNIPGATSSQFVIVQVGQPDVAKYDVVVTNACGTATSNAAQLSIVPPPAITTQPVSQTRFEGGSVTFTVAATGGLTFQWRRNGVNIAGATSSSFTIAAVTTADAGNYDVVVTGGCGTVTSAVAILTVNQCPAITVNPATGSLPAASTGIAYSQTFTATGGVAPVTFSVIGTLPAGLILNATGVLSGTPTGMGNFSFTIRATDANGCAGSRDYTLSVTQCIAPAITVQPVDRTICGGTSAFFNVTATGTNLTYQWRKDGVNIPGATSSQFVIVQVGQPDVAKYDVVVTNVCGTATSNAAQLSIVPPPAITTQPISQTRFEGGSVTFTVTAMGGLTFQWRRNGVNIAGATSSSFTIAAVTTADAGNYDVVVTGGCGAVTSAFAVLTVNQCPSITIIPAAGALPSGVIGTAYSQTFTTSGGVAPVTLSLTGTLPGGLSFNATTGVLSGTPTATGAFSFMITARDANGCVRIQNYTLVVGLVPPTGDACRLTICFRSANYFSLNWGTNNIPNGAVLIDGVNFGTPLASTDPRVKLALDGNFGALNRQYVAAQLNILGASGLGAANVLTAMLSQLRCYGLDFDPVTVSGAPPFTRETTLFDLIQYLNTAVKQGISGRDACVLTRILNGLNGDSNRNVCHRPTAKLDFSSCN